MASAMCQAYPAFYSDYNAKPLSISVSEFFMKSSLTLKTTVYLTIPHSIVESCKYHLMLIGSSIDQILLKLDKFLFTYQIVDCIYTIYKYKLYSKVISSRGEVFNQLM